MTVAAQTSQQSEETQGTAPGHWQPARRRPLTILVTCILVVIALLLVLAAWGLPPFSAGNENTDNAYVRGRTTVIAPQVSGYVMQVLVRDYETVKPGQLLVKIDDRIYRARVEQARANLAAAEAALANSTQARAARTAGLEGQVAGVASAQAQLVRARADMDRANDLVRDGSISLRERDQTLAALALAQAQVRQSRASTEIGRQDIRTVDVGRGGLEAQVQAARAQLHAAEIDLEHTVIRAPEGGRLGEVSIRVGAYVTNGTQLLAVVPPERWIIANMKEAQTGHIRPGQSVSFTVDALAGETFVGRVERLAPAAGSEFAVLKQDNATGNFVKIPQRIGVRIAVDPRQRAAARLLPGMSVEVSIDTGSSS
ncbi:HlyD family secretion protein [Novosphingobium sp. SG707]|uniref:HlyD family secretion protein n=1 Tax=Novosphingobium sp. SG707 TaxID=2586996 RepID=UPI001448894E|nr:HlyD family secretion protein [Novosphingobium sp. SG707]NKJ02419.1 multidrug resistance efflux pump [Novosphingobium sp. SG707]